MNKIEKRSRSHVETTISFEASKPYKETPADERLFEQVLFQLQQT